MLMLFMISYYIWISIPPLVLSFNQSYQIMIEMAAVIKHFVEVIVKDKNTNNIQQIHYLVTNIT